MAEYSYTLMRLYRQYSRPS